LSFIFNPGESHQARIEQVKAGALSYISSSGSKEIFIGLKWCVAAIQKVKETWFSRRTVVEEEAVIMLTSE
jgi:hypothetical protein